MIDQGQHLRRARARDHLFRFRGVHRHRLFAKDSLPMIERRQGDLEVGGGRSNHAHEIDVITFYQLQPVVSDVFDAKLFRDTLGAFTMPAGDGDDTRALAVKKSGNLRRARKAGADYADAYRLFVSLFNLHVSELIEQRFMFAAGGRRVSLVIFRVNRPQHIA